LRLTRCLVPLPPDVDPAHALSPAQVLSPAPAAPNQPVVPDRAQDLVLPSTGPALPGLIDDNDPQSPPTLSSTPQTDVSMALVLATVPNQSMTPVLFCQNHPRQQSLDLLRF
jgi:hypothetical protein